MKLDGKVAVVTGAARGIGKAIADCFAKEGANVVLSDIDETAVIATAQSIKETYGMDAIAVKANVAVKEDNDAMVQKAIDVFGKLDILACNAGIVRKACPIEDITPQQWEQVIGINLMGQIYATQAFIPHIKAQNSGKIIYMSSVAGEVGGVAAEATYSITKAGILCLAKAVAKQLAPYNANVNAIAPGTIQTNMTEILQYPSSVLASIPLKRYGEVADIAAAALYLASEDSKYITGTTLDVNGGMYMK